MMLSDLRRRHTVLLVLLLPLCALMALYLGGSSHRPHTVLQALVYPPPTASTPTSHYQRTQQSKQSKGNPQSAAHLLKPLEGTTTPSERTNLTTQDRQEPGVLNVEGSSKYVLPTKSPEELLHCVEALMRSHIADIERAREALHRNSHEWRPYQTNSERSLTYAESNTYFQDIASHPQIQTLLFNETKTKAMECMINGGLLHYDYGINSCSRVLSQAKRHEMFGKIAYGVRCVERQSEALTSLPVQDAAFEVGLPAQYEHGDKTKTLGYLHVIIDATITVYGDITVGNVDIIAQRCYQNKRIIVPDDPTELPLYREVFSFSQYFGKGMFHANIEDVSRMAPYVSFLQEHPDIYLHVFDTEFPPIFLSMINLNPRRFIDGTIRANVLYTPGGVNCCLPSVVPTMVESFHLRRDLPNLPGASRDTIIIIKRRQRRNRFFRNHVDIVQMVRRKAGPRGLKVWTFGDSPLPSLNQTAHMFNRAFLIIAPHGAGEANVIFSQPGTILLEGLCRDCVDKLVNVVFRSLAHILGLYYYGFYKQDAHCTETTASDLEPLLTFYLDRLNEFR